MYLVTPYKADPNNGIELKYCIRSMVKYFYGMNGVCIIGDKPDWYTGEYLQAVDITGRKEWSIVSKVLMAPYENFIFTSDDYFALQPFTEDLPHYYSGLLRDTSRYGKYADRIEHTMRIYPNGKFFDIHTPIAVNRDQFKEAHNIAWNEREYLSKSIYCNFINAEGVQIPDTKIRTGSSIPDAPFFSTSDRTAKLINFDELFPEKSPYEL